MSTMSPEAAASFFSFLESATRVAQSLPRTENSTGHPRWPAKPCWERSWTEARIPGYDPSSLRQTADSWLWVILRWFGGTSVTGMLPPPGLTLAITLATSGWLSKYFSARCASALVSSKLDPTTADSRTARRLWSCDGTNSCLMSVAVYPAAPKTTTPAPSTSQGHLSARSRARAYPLDRAENALSAIRPKRPRGSWDRRSIGAQRAGASVMAST